MQRQVCFLVFVFLMLAALPLWAQELTGFEAQRVNKRYEINYELRNFPWGDRCDVFFFARVDEQSPWFKVRALVGQFKNVESSGSYTVLWEPILDFKEYKRYDFRIFAVNKRYLGRNYDYEKVNEVGLVYPVSAIQSAGYSINGVKLESSVPVALPVGSYEFGISKDNILRGKRSVDLLAFRYIEPELEYQDGTLTLRSAETDTKFMVDGKVYNSVNKMKITIGDHNIEVVPPKDVQVLGITNLKETISVGEFEDVVRDYSFPYGKLSLSSNEDKVEYSINETKYAEIINLKLKPGTYKVKATLKSDQENMQFRLEETFVVLPGSAINHNFDFKYGYLSFFNPHEDCRYELYNIPLKTRPNNLKLSVGDYEYIVHYKYPYKPIVGTFHINEGEHFAKTLKFVKDKELVRNERKREFQASLTTKPLTHISLDHYFLLDGSDADSVFSDSNPLGKYSMATGFTLSGFQFRKTLGPTDYQFLDQIQYPSIFLSLGILDNVSLAYHAPSKNMIVLFDWIKVGVGSSLLNKRGTIFSNVEAKFVFGGQNPLYREFNVNGEEFKYVREFKVTKPTEDDTNQTPKRSIIQSSYNQLGGELDLQVGFHLTRGLFMYSYATARYSSKMGGGWYRSGDVNNWLYNGTNDKPSSYDYPQFPKRNAIYDGMSYQAGIGFGFSIFGKNLNRLLF